MHIEEHCLSLGQSPKLCMGSSSTLDGENYTVEDPVVIWQPIWLEVVYRERDEQACHYCPGCFRKVKVGELVQETANERERRFLAHVGCSVEENFITEFTKIAQKTALLSNFIPLAPRLGSQEYMVTLVLNHPLNSHKFYSGCTRLLLDSSNKLNHDFRTKAPDMFQPGCIVLPIKEFSVSLELQDLSARSSGKKFLKFNIDLSTEREGVVFVVTSEGEITFSAELEILENTDKKIAEVDSLSYKYPFCVQETDLVKLRRYHISFSKDETTFAQTQFKKNSECSPLYLSAPIIAEFAPISLEASSEAENRQFINWIKTQAGSKEFQRKVKALNEEEIESTVQKLLPYLPEVILNDYANYMFQSLLRVSNISQRLRIVENIRYSLCDLACSQQGTFVFQQLIDYLSNIEEYELLSQILTPELYRLFRDVNGNHFMRKFIQCMPRHLLFSFMPTVVHNFMEFSMDKNAVCVLKCVLRALCEGQTLIYDLFQETKKLLDQITLNTKELINDEFGNYIIQEAYEVFPLERMEGVTSYILKTFSRCACERYSSNVLQNCVKKYWVKSEAPFKTLRGCLENKSITYMYRNKEGNKVLLEIVSLPYQLGIKDKIWSVIINEQSSKFNNRRWLDVTDKSKTDRVGTTYSNFSEAHQKTPKRKHYN